MRQDQTWSDDFDQVTPDSEASLVETIRDTSKSRLTYGGLIFLLQNLGIEPCAVQAYRFSTLIDQGTYFAVYKQKVRPVDHHALQLVISKPGEPLFTRPFARVNDTVAVKRIRVRDDIGSVDISDQGRLQAIFQEITALVHPALRDHEGIVKLQAIIWENGPGAGNEAGLMWPVLIMEYCQETLANYQKRMPPLAEVQLSFICARVGEGLDAVHSANIFHGDLKSENILLKFEEDGSFCPKLADFGCSIVIKDDAGRAKYRVGGTPLWRAPECPGTFTTIEQVEATDWYSFGLLIWRVQGHGKNPFEELGVIDPEWTTLEKSKAVQFMKETDCLYAFLNDVADKLPVPESIRQLANMLIADPVERMKSMESLGENVQSLVPEVFDWMKESEGAGLHSDLMTELSDRIRGAVLEDEQSDTCDDQEDRYEAIDPLSYLTYITTRSLILDFNKLSKVNRKAALNSATRQRVVSELVEHVEEHPISRCEACCSANFASSPHPVVIDAHDLIDRIRIWYEFTLGSHTCVDQLGPPTSNENPELLTYLWGQSSFAKFRRWKATLELFLVTATGFGVQEDCKRALELLVDTAATGNIEAAAWAYRYAMYTGQNFDPSLLIRELLAIYIIFFAGVPSTAFLVLTKTDPYLAGVTATARSKLYNGSISNRDNLRWNLIGVTGLRLLANPQRISDSQILSSSDFSPPEGFIYSANGITLLQDELHHNSLLHLIAGSDNEDSSLVGFCIHELGIDKNLRNKAGVTPLLLACRSGKEKMIVALLDNDVDVTLCYPGGENPIHWLILLPDPLQIVQKFVARGADINACVERPNMLPNFEGSKDFFVAGTPLFWAVAMDNERFMDALLESGADIQAPGVSGLSLIAYTCRPNIWKHLRRLQREDNFRITEETAYQVLISWSRMELLANFVPPEEHGECLEFVLSCAMNFSSLAEVQNFYRHLIPKAIEECEVEIIEIVLRGLSASIATLPESDTETEQYARSPLSHSTWTEYRLEHYAAQRGDSSILRSVLKWGGDALALDDFGRTALHSLSFSSDNAECVDILARNGALYVLNERLEIEGLTAFGNAVACGNYAVANRLWSFTPAEEKSKLLSSEPAGMWHRNLSLFGHFIAWASELGEKPIQYLLSLPELRQDPQKVFIVDTTLNVTALMTAAGFSSDTMIYNKELFVAIRQKATLALLLKTFPEQRHLDWRNIYGDTALHMAALMGSSEVAKSLIAAGASLNYVNAWRLTPLDVLFASKPDCFQTDLDSKKRAVEEFADGRNKICVELRKRGGRHNHPMSTALFWAQRLPCPEGNIDDLISRLNSGGIASTQLVDDVE